MTFLRKNVAEQYVYCYLYDSTSMSPITGDAGNISAFVAKDAAALGAATNGVSEVSAANAPGVYQLEVAQAESNVNTGVFTFTTTTANGEIEPVPFTTFVWSYDGILWEDVISAMMSVLMNVAVKSTGGVDFMKRDGITKKVEIVHDNVGSRTSSTIN
jgi:hypothetical protein